MAHDAIERFLDAAQEYVAVIDAGPAGADRDALDDFLFTVVRALTALHHAALGLPKAAEDDDGGADIPTDRAEVERRLRTVLGELDDTRDVDPYDGSPAFDGSLAYSLAKVWDGAVRAVAERDSPSLWNWRFDFWAGSWGEHGARALRVLHDHLRSLGPVFG